MDGHGGRKPLHYRTIVRIVRAASCATSSGEAASDGMGNSFFPRGQPALPPTIVVALGLQPIADGC